MNEEQNIPEIHEVDLVEMMRKVWDKRKLVVKNCFVAAVAGVIIAFSIPKEFETKVTLAPEESVAGGGLGGNLGSLASLAGINLGSMGSEDAYSPELYPEILASSPFLVELFPVQVQTKKGDLQTTLYDYLDEHQRSSWFGYLLGAPGKAIGWFFSLFREKEKEGNPADADYFNLSRDQELMVKDMRKIITAEVSKKTGVITIAVRMQDPLISAALADTVCCRLQEYITDYRTRKAKNDLVFSEKIFEEAKADYLQAQKEYAAFVDGNLDVVQQRFKAEEERLEKEVSLTYNVYSQVASQLQVAKAKVQQQTPAYTVIQPAAMSFKAASPKKFMILLAFVFLGFVGTAAWVLFKDDLMKQFKKERA